MENYNGGGMNPDDARFHAARMRIVHDAHPCSDEGDRELILPKPLEGRVTGPLIHPDSGETIGHYWADPVSDVPPDTDVVANTSNLVRSEKGDLAVRVIVHTGIESEVKRKLLLKLALETVQVVELSVAGMSDNQAMEELVKMGEVKVEGE